MALHPGRLTMAEAASYTTISCLLRRQLSMKSNSGLSRLQGNRRQEDAVGPPRGWARARGARRRARCHYLPSSSSSCRLATRIIMQ